jgi:hypothetical protein
MTQNIFESHLALENILDEMNLRCRQYHKGSNSISVADAQDQTLQDFRTYNKDGKYVPAKGKIVDDVYFIEKAQK